MDFNINDGVPSWSGGTSFARQPPPAPAAARPTGIPPTANAPVSAALFGAVIGGANEFGRNLHRMRRKEITLAQAIGRSLMRGAATSLATTTAAVLTANLTQRDVMRFAALAATTATLSYLISGLTAKEPKKSA
jgi:ABC-type Fe3+ transport system permease subunit